MPREYCLFFLVFYTFLHGGERRARDPLLVLGAIGNERGKKRKGGGSILQTKKPLDEREEERNGSILGRPQREKKNGMEGCWSVGSLSSLQEIRFVLCKTGKTGKIGWDRHSLSPPLWIVSGDPPMSLNFTPRFLPF